MKNILLLTTIYPAPDLKYGTSAIHYFTREWVKMSYNVKVIHFLAVYPSFLYFIAKLFREKIASKTGAIVFTKREKEEKKYTLDGVQVYRMPVFKMIPYGKYTQKVIHKQVVRITEISKAENFIPDIIIGHFNNPQLVMLSHLKKIFSAKSVLVMHDGGDNIKRVFRSDYLSLMKNIDLWGFRSQSNKRRFDKNYEKEFGKNYQSFFPYSGIPQEYITQKPDKKCSGQLNKFVYAGDLIKLKNVSTIIEALNDVYPDKQFVLSIIGEGAERKNIEAKVSSYNIESNVKFRGRLSRIEVQKILDSSDCFIMISSPEAFGLVYLEAMAKGCITIGSRNEGIDGVIIHGVNGFLCEAGNAMELAQLIKHINQLSSSERKRISENAIATAKELTDYKAALNYISAIIC